MQGKKVTTENEALKMLVNDEQVTYLAEDSMFKCTKGQKMNKNVCG